LLPNTTKEFLHFNLPRLEQGFPRTQWAAMLTDFRVIGFASTLLKQLNDDSELVQRFGFSSADLRPATAGQATWAVIQPAPREAAHVLLVDVTGKRAQAEALRKRAGQKLQERGGQYSRRTVGQTMLDVYQFPATRRELKPSQVVLLIKDDLLIVGDHLPAVEGILRRWSGPCRDCLKEMTAYQKIMQRCEERAGSKKESQQLCWFIEPIGRLETARAEDPRSFRGGPDTVNVLKKEGCEAIRGVGGFVNFAVGEYDLLHQSAVYAPRKKGGFGRGLGLLTLPSGSDFTPPSWVPDDSSVFVSAYLDVPRAFEALGCLFDTVYANGAAGTFTKVVDSVQDDTDGQQLDIRADLIDNLGPRVFLVRDGAPLQDQAGKPVARERTLLAFEIQPEQEATVATAVHRFFEGDARVHLRRLEGTPHSYWEIAISHTADGVKRISRSGLVVADGYLFYATDVDLLQKVLGNHPSLSRAADYQRVSQEMVKLGADSDCCLRLFERPGDNLRNTYEALRTGKLTNLRAVYGQVFGVLFPSNGTKGETTRKFDRSGMPSFEVLNAYLGPAGTFAINQDDGWVIVGFTLKKKSPELAGR